LKNRGGDCLNREFQCRSLLLVKLINSHKKQEEIVEICKLNDNILLWLNKKMKRFLGLSQIKTPF